MRAVRRAVFVPAAHIRPAVFIVTTSTDWPTYPGKGSRPRFDYRRAAFSVMGGLRTSHSTERLPETPATYARMAQALRWLGLALGGEAGSRTTAQRVNVCQPSRIEFCMAISDLTVSRMDFSVSSLKPNSQHVYRRNLGTLRSSQELLVSVQHRLAFVYLGRWLNRARPKRDTGLRGLKTDFLTRPFAFRSKICSVLARWVAAVAIRCLIHCKF